MTLKTTLLVWEPMVTYNGLVSCVIGLDEKLWPLMTSIDSNMFFSTKANLYCHVKSLSIRHADVLKSKNVWASIITSLLHLTMIATKKHGDGFEHKFGPFSLHGASRSNFMVPIKTIHAHFLTLLVVDYNNQYGTPITS
jgi:hypothetical protein